MFGLHPLFFGLFCLVLYGLMYVALKMLTPLGNEEFRRWFPVFVLVCEGLVLVMVNLLIGQFS